MTQSDHRSSILPLLLPHLSICTLFTLRLVNRNYSDVALTEIKARASSYTFEPLKDTIKERTYIPHNATFRRHTRPYKVPFLAQITIGSPPIGVNVSHPRRIPSYYYDIVADSPALILDIIEYTSRKVQDQMQAEIAMQGGYHFDTQACCVNYTVKRVEVGNIWIIHVCEQHRIGGGRTKYEIDTMTDDHWCRFPIGQMVVIGTHGCRMKQWGNEIEIGTFFTDQSLLEAEHMLIATEQRWKALTGQN